MTEAEKEFKKMNDRISETREAMQVVFKNLFINIRSDLYIFPCMIKPHFAGIISGTDGRITSKH